MNRLQTQESQPKQKPLTISGFLYLVTSEGFEPPTAGAEIQCSIQLSHEAGFKITR